MLLGELELSLGRPRGWGFLGAANILFLTWVVVT